MSSREYVDVRGPSVETAIEAGLEELGLKSQDEAEIEVLQQPTRGFLGIGGEGAVVRIKRKPPKPSNGRRSRGSGGDTRHPRGGAGTKPRESDQRSSSGGRGGDRGSKSASSPKPRPPKRDDRSKEREEMRARPDDRDVIGVDEQAAEIERFLKGLLEAYGLEGKVSVRVEEEIIYADVAGEQTEALVGTKGVILQSVLELCRTIVQRKTQEGARIRLDIAGYTERRREALRIYARRLADKVIAEGGEVMLEPMNSADRKVVHDTVGEIDGVRSYSEGEEPHRSVIVAAE